MLLVLRNQPGARIPPPSRVPAWAREVGDVWLVFSLLTLAFGVKSQPETELVSAGNCEGCD